MVEPPKSPSSSSSPSAGSLPPLDSAGATRNFSQTDFIQKVVQCSLFSFFFSSCSPGKGNPRDYFLYFPFSLGVVEKGLPVFFPSPSLPPIATLSPKTYQLNFFLPNVPQKTFFPFLSITDVDVAAFFPPFFSPSFFCSFYKPVPRIGWLYPFFPFFS